MSFALNDVIAVVLAGGFGTRIQHLLDGIPKPMVSVAGKPFVEWVVRYWGIQGITQSILSTGYLAEVIEQHFQNQPVKEVQVTCYQETNPLGTAGGFLNAANQTGKTPPAWLVMNGDSLVFADLTSLTNHLMDANVSGVILGLKVPDASRYGSLVWDENGNLVRFAEKKSGSGVINAGVYLLRESLLHEFPQGLPLSFENEVFPALLAKNMRLRVEVTDAPFLDIGTPQSLPQAEEFILQNLSKFKNLC